MPEVTFYTFSAQPETPEGAHFIVAVARDQRDGFVLEVETSHIVEDGGDLIGLGRGGNIPIRDGTSHAQVANSPADDIGFISARPEPLQDGHDKSGYFLLTLRYHCAMMQEKPWLFNRMFLDRRKRKILPRRHKGTKKSIVIFFVS
jgi:hypothetical protein